MARRRRSLHDRYLFPRISRADRQRLARRSERQARRMFAPDIAAARSGVQAVKRQRRKELQSVEGASDALQGIISQSIKDLKGSGLSGSSRHLIAQELSARRVDAAQSVPLLKADVRQSYIEPMATARGELATAKIDRVHEAQTTLSSLLEKARTQSRSAMKARASSESGGKKKELADAIKVAVLRYRKGPDTGEKDDSGEIPWRPPYTDKKDWSNYVSAILGSEGVTDPQVAVVAAREAIYRVLNRQAERAGHSKVSRDFFQRWLRAQLNR